MVHALGSMWCVGWIHSVYTSTSREPRGSVPLLVKEKLESIFLFLTLLTAAEAEAWTCRIPFGHIIYIMYIFLGAQYTNYSEALAKPTPGTVFIRVLFTLKLFVQPWKFIVLPPYQMEIPFYFDRFLIHFDQIWVLTADLSDRMECEYYIRIEYTISIQCIVKFDEKSELQLAYGRLRESIMAVGM